MKSKYIFPILSIARTVNAIPVPQSEEYIEYLSNLWPNQDSIDPPLVARDEKPSATSAADSCGHSGSGDWSGTRL
jgi:hypothetical protein